MVLHVLFFANLVESTCAREMDFEAPERVTLAQLKKMLDERFPGLSLTHRAVLAAVNREFAFDEDEIPSGAEVAFFPPVSGGSCPTVCLITQDELDLDDLLRQITLPTTGAACFFTGIVREVTSRGEAHVTHRLEYEAYVPMAVLKMRQLAEEIRERWRDVEGIAIVQRVGILFPQTPTVIIACTASHRDSGIFEAARYGIDRLKEIVPIWKKESGPDGEAWVEGDYIPKPGE